MVHSVPVLFFRREIKLDVVENMMHFFFKKELKGRIFRPQIYEARQLNFKDILSN
jgi:hypothetical protein